MNYWYFSKSYLSIVTQYSCLLGFFLVLTFMIHQKSPCGTCHGSQIGAHKIFRSTERVWLALFWFTGRNYMEYFVLFHATTYVCINLIFLTVLAEFTAIVILKLSMCDCSSVNSKWSLFFFYNKEARNITIERWDELTHTFCLL